MRSFITCTLYQISGWF